MNSGKLLILACLIALPCLTEAQVRTPSQPVPSTPNVNPNPNLKVDPKLRLNPASQKLTGGSRKRWALTAITTNGHKQTLNSGTCYSDNELILSSDQTATYSEGQNLCTKSISGVNNMQWKISADGKKFTLAGIPAMKKDNSNALIGFCLGPDSEVIELTDTTFRIKFKGSDGFMPDGTLIVITNEITYTAK